MALKEQIEEVVKNTDHIPGIYNYCDRWCDRCDKTGSCTNFAIGVGQFPDPESNDINDEGFWSQLDEVFKATIEMLQEMADEQGVDLNEIDIEAAEAEDKLLVAVAHDHICCKMAEKYISYVNDWFDSNQDLFEKKCNDLERQGEINLPNTDIGAVAERLNDDIEVIRWYQTQIFVKMMRAVEGQEVLEEDAVKDADGSAKVALLAIDRSIAAWSDLRHTFPSQADAILDILIFLGRLRNNTEDSFPNARSFIRPGFDD